jgi:hypothetical protein
LMAVMPAVPLGVALCQTKPTPTAILPFVNVRVAAAFSS